MWLEFLRFDLRYQWRQPILWIMTVALVAVAVLSASSDTARIGGAIGNIYLNAPVIIVRVVNILCFASMLLVTVLIAGSFLRDSEVGIADMIFATPMRKRDYLLGRFLAGFSLCLAVFALVCAAMAAGAQLPFIDPGRLGTFSPSSYVFAFVVFVVPNLLFITALLTLLAVTTRSLLFVYVGVVAFAVFWAMTGFLITDPRHEMAAVMLDPFGIRAMSSMTRYYSAAELDRRLPEMTGYLLENRVVWTSVSLGFLAAALMLFKPQRAGTSRRRFGRISPDAMAPAPLLTGGVVRRVPVFAPATAWRQCWSIFRFDAKALIKSVPFLIMLMLAALNFVINVTIDGLRFDSVTYPLTGRLLNDLSGGFYLVLNIILVFYAGELVFKERQAKMAAVCDAMPVPNWVPLVAKCAALLGVIAVYMSVGVAIAVVIQWVHGGVPIEWGLYLRGVLLASAYYAIFGLTAIAIQVLTRSKFAGYALSVLLLASDGILDGLHLNHRLYHFASLPPLPYSDMNGYGHFLTGWSWFAVYWGSFAVALLIVAQAFLVRGVESGRNRRLATALRNFGGAASLALGACVLVFAGSGAWIYYNTNVLNRYVSDNTRLDDAAEYEKHYRQYLGLPHPKITDVRADVDIFPAQRRVAIRGRYVLANKTSGKLDVLRIQEDANAQTRWLNLPAHRVLVHDDKFRFSVIQLDKPLAPGATLALNFTVDVVNAGFTNSGQPDSVNYNGTVFTFAEVFPQFGYDRSREISDPNERKARGLGAWQRKADLDDESMRSRSFYDTEADLIHFETTVSTSADQIAITSGNLEKSWEDKGRRYFHYKAEQPISPFFAYVSAKWEIRKADWHGIPIEVYYDHKHPYNVDSMIRGVQDGLAYYTEHFGPYPNKQVRVLEVPNYIGYAQSFPGVIPFSESLGFVSDLSDENRVDHVYYITAHELAHQWWGDQIIAADVQGSGMVIESLAEYSALMVVEKKYGAEKVGHILDFDRDEYLSGRSKEPIAEQPLYRTEDQVYLQYRKGSLIFERLRALIGEAAVDRALRRLLDEHRYQVAPYVTSRDVLAYLREETPADKQSLVDDLFEKIVFYDNRIDSATAKRRADGSWEVTVKLHLAKLEADGRGQESPRTYDEPVTVEVLGAVEKSSVEKSSENGKVLFDEERRLTGGDSVITLTVSEKPVDVVLDPSKLLIDRNLADNRKAVVIDATGE